MGSARYPPRPLGPPGRHRYPPAVLPPAVRSTPTHDDLDAVGRLATRIARATPDRADADALDRLDATDLHPAPTLALVPRIADRAELAACAHAARTGTGRWNLALLVDPDDLDDLTSLGAAALHPVLAGVAEAGGGTVDWWVRGATDADAALAAALGFELEREVVQLRRPLPLDEGTDLPVRPFRWADADAWLEVNNRAFADHPDQGAWTRADLDRRLAEPWYDRRGFLLHDDAAGEIDGFCWTKVHADADPPLGEIYVIAVDPAAGGRGLGHDLVVAGLTWLADRGLRTGMLWTESDNERARRLYEARLGFELHHADRQYRAQIAPA